jgi:hypothetical protein
MKHTLRFYFSIALLLFSLFFQAQEAKTKDSIPPKKERYGIRVGMDLFKLTRSFYDKKYKGLELVGDYRLTRRHYIAAEIGNENKTVDEDRLNFTTKGTYLKVGFDYNGYENWLDMENQIYVGMRYGVSSFSQTLNSYKIYYTNNPFQEVIDVNPNEQFKGLSAQWLEVVAGMKAEIFNNFYAGFSFRLNYMLSQKQPSNFENLYIPGFNRTYDGKFGVGFNYTISYFIPLYKSTVKQKVTKKK